MGGVALLEVLDDAEGVEVVVEAAAMKAEALVQGALAGVAEGRMANVVDEGKGLGKVFVEAEFGGSGAGDLGDLDGVGEAAAKVVGGSAGEDLRLAGEAAEGAGLHDALAIALERRPRGTGRRVDAGQKWVIRIIRAGGDRAEMQIGGHGLIRV
jgi:hypothetical protein